MKEITVYKFTNNKTHMSYIGITKDVERRFKEHQYNIRHKLVTKRQLYEGNIEDYSFTVLERHVPYEIRHERERFYINAWKTLYPLGYNVVDGASRYQGQKEKDKRSRKLTGRFVSENTRKKLSETRLSMNIKESSETKRKIGENSRRQWADPNYRKKVMESRRETFSDPAFKERRSKAMKDYNSTLTPEQRSEKYNVNGVKVAVINLETKEKTFLKTKSRAVEFLGLTCSGTKINNIIKNGEIVNNKYKVELQ